MGRPVRKANLSRSGLAKAFLPAAFLALLGATGCREKAPPYDDATAAHRDLSGEKAFAHVEKLVAFGPRPAGSEALEQSRRYLEEQLAATGWSVHRQAFAASTPKGEIEFVNLVARFAGASDAAPARPAEVLLCSHYDTKLFEGFEFVGANDGGSSTGLLLELARVFAASPRVAERLELVFFDGEEAFGSNISTRDGLYGSRHYAGELLALPKKERPRRGVLLDMVGDRDLRIRASVQIPGPRLDRWREATPGADDRETSAATERKNLQASLRQMTLWLLDAAKELDQRDRIGIHPDYIIDDHIPLNVAAGIPTINLIDFDYAPWHTPGDTLDKISAESLETVGKVTALLVEKHLLGAGQ